MDFNAINPEIITSLGFNVFIIIYFMKENSKKDERMVSIMSDFKDTVANNTLALEQLRSDLINKK